MMPAALDLPALISGALGMATSGYLDIPSAEAVP